MSERVRTYVPTQLVQLFNCDGLLYCRDDFTALLKGGQLCDTQSMKVSGGRMEMGMEERKCVGGRDDGEGRECDGEDGEGRECDGEDGERREWDGEDGEGREWDGEDGEGREWDGEDGEGREWDGEDGEGREWDEEDGGRTEYIVCEGECPRI